MRTSLVCTVASVAGIALAAPAIAQPQAAPAETGQGASEAQGLAEIIVTAQKRAQNLQTVPVAVTAIEGEALQAKNITQFAGISQLAPSLTITEASESTTSSINLRGIGTFAFSQAVEPSVLVVVDDVAILQQAQAFTGLSDIERVEVLRGPQGTLFGKGASAGAINIVTRAPSKTFTGRIGGTATTDEQYRIEGALSGPLSDRVGFRLNAYYDDREGYIDNLTNGHKLAGETSWGLRGRLTAELSERLSASLMAMRAVNENNGVPPTYRVLAPGAVGFLTPPFSPGVPLASSAAGLTPGPGNYKTRLNVDPYNKQEQTTASGRATLDLGMAQLISITSYQVWNLFNRSDVDNTDIPFFGPDGVSQGGPTKSKVFAQELRLVSSGGGPLQYLAGLYYSDGNTTRSFSRIPAGPLRSETRAANGTRTYAAFGQVTYDFSPTTHVDAGVRFNREKIKVDFTRLIPGTCTTTCSGRNSDDQVTYKAALRQDLARGIMAYGSYATGYKGQAFDISSSFTQANADAPVRPETSRAWEAGLKSRFWENRVQLNVAAFLTDYNDFQAQSVVVLPDQTVLFRLNNVGKLRTQGVEVELAVNPTRGLTLGASAAYIDAKIRSFPLANCYTRQTAAEGCFDIDGSGPGTATAQNLAGQPLANAPKFKYTLSATYQFELPHAPFDGFIGVDWRHQSAVNFDLGRNPAYGLGGYGVFNANVGIQQKGGGYRLTLFVNNLFDEHYVGTLTTQAGGATQPPGVPIVVNQTLPRDSRRYFGMRASYDF